MHPLFAPSNLKKILASKATHTHTPKRKVSEHWFVTFLPFLLTPCSSDVRRPIKDLSDPWQMVSPGGTQTLQHKCFCDWKNPCSCSESVPYVEQLSIYEQQRRGILREIQKIHVKGPGSLRTIYDCVSKSQRKFGKCRCLRFPQEGLGMCCLAECISL